jgi:hypothetical protein
MILKIIKIYHACSKSFVLRSLSIQYAEQSSPNNGPIQKNYINGLIIYTGTKAKCCHLKNLTCKETLLQGLSDIQSL